MPSKSESGPIKVRRTEAKANDFSESSSVTCRLH